MSAALVAAFLRRFSASELAARAVVRGSQLTAQWVPGRTANDVDFLMLDSTWTTSSLDAALREVLGTLHARSEVIWAETESPGIRLRVGFTGDAHPLQIDFGWGDPLAAPPRPVTVEGVPLLGVAPEVMFGWKVHGLVEFGRGRWLAKTLADIVLINRHVKLDPALTRAAIELAFSSRRLPISALDELFDDPSWGQSRGSRNKWKTLKKRNAWVPIDLHEAVEEARRVVGGFLGR